MTRSDSSVWEEEEWTEALNGGLLEDICEGDHR